MFCASKGTPPGVLQQVNYIIIMKLHNKQAFSLIELLVALSILAVVAAVIVPRFLNVRAQASQTTTQTQQQTVQRAVQQWLSLGGTCSAGTTTAGKQTAALDIITLLGTPSRAAGSPQGTAKDSSTANFGSNTIGLNLSTGSATTQGFYSAGGLQKYCDGAGNIYTVSVNPSNGNTMFTIDTAATGFSSVGSDT